MELFTYSCNLAPTSVAGTVLTGSSTGLAECFETSLPLELRTKRLYHKLDQFDRNMDASIKKEMVCFHDGQSQRNVLSDYQIITKKNIF
jgi:transcription elongation factor Elf1